LSTFFREKSIAFFGQPSTKIALRAKIKLAIAAYRDCSGGQ
jgi:hypothetical protein